MFLVNLISCKERIIGKKGTVFVEEAMLVKQSRTFSCRERLYDEQITIYDRNVDVQNVYVSIIVPLCAKHRRTHTKIRGSFSKERKKIRGDSKK